MKRRMGWMALGVLVVLPALLALALWQGVPRLLPRLAANAAQAELGRTLTLGAVEFDLPHLRLTLRDIRLKSADGQSDAVSVDHLMVDLAAASLTQQAPVLDTLQLDGLQLTVVQDAQGGLSFDDVLQRLAAKPASPGPARFALHNIRIAGASVLFRDEARGHDIRLSDIALDLPFVSSLPSDIKIAVQPRLSARLEGSPLQLEATATPFDESHAASLSLTLQGLPLAEFNPYWPTGSGLKLGSGDASLTVKLDFADKGAQRSLAIAGQLGVSNLDLIAPTFGGGAFSVLRAGRLSAEWADLKPFEQQLTVTRFTADGMKLVVHRDAAGRLEGLHRLSTPAPAGARAAPSDRARAAAVADTASAPAKPWRVNLKSLDVSGLMADYRDDGLTAHTGSPLLVNVRGGSVRLDDLSWPALSTGGAPASARAQVAAQAIDIQEAFGARAQRIRLSDLSASTPALSFDPAVPLPLRAAFRLQDGGQVQLDGKVTPSQAAIDLDVRLNQFPLVVAQPHLEPFARVAVDQGRLGASLRVVSDAQGLQLKGDAGLQGLRTRDTIDNRRLLDVGSLQVKGLQVQQAPGKPLRLTVGGVNVADVDGRLVLKSDGHLNVSDLLVKPQSPVSGGPEPIVDVGRVALSNINVSFTDNVVKPAFSARLTGLTGGLSAFSSSGSRLSTVELNGSLDGDGLLVVSGQLNPVKPRDYLNISLRARGIEMTRLSPYAAKYAGYNIAKGKLSTTLTYRVEKGQLSADNALFLDQLTFGDAVDSPDATTLPVRLGVALLKNLKGEIDLNLPVSGSLSDPQFSLGRVVFKAIGNVLLKAVAAPFTLLSSAVSGSQEMVSGVDFEPGVATVSEAAERQIRGLAQLLAEKKGVELEVTGFADTLNDTLGIRRERIRQRVVRAWQAADPVRTGNWRDIPDKQRLQATEKVYADTEIKNKPKNLIGLNRSLTEPEMLTLLESTVAVGPEDLKRLAYERAVAAKNAIALAKPEVADRVFLVAPSAARLGAQAEKPRAWVEFVLR